MNNKVVYRHIRLDNDQVFYIGMGTKDRPYQITGRNQYWDHIYMNHGHRVEIIAKNLSEEDALDLEALLIESYGRLIEGGTLVNLVKDSREPKQKLPWRVPNYWMNSRENWDKAEEYRPKTYTVSLEDIINSHIDSFNRRFKNISIINDNEIWKNELPNSYIDIHDFLPIDMDLWKDSKNSSESFLLNIMETRRRTIRELMTESQLRIIDDHNKKYNKR